jgi:hypothetical protein
MNNRPRRPMDRALASGASLAGSIPAGGSLFKNEVGSWKLEVRKSQEPRAKSKTLNFSVGSFFVFSTFALLISIFGFLFSSDVFAEAVYLKNGSVMTGRVVEMTKRKIVLQTGEGGEAVKTTIYAEDINRVVSDEEYAQSVAQMPMDLKDKLTASGVGMAAALTPATSSDPRERIRQMIEASREVALEKAVEQGGGEGVPDNEPPVSPEAMSVRGGPEVLAAHSQMILERKKQLKAMAEGKATPDAKGEGHIAGIVTLPGRPLDWGLTGEAKGDLFVYLMKESAEGIYVAPMLFDRIQADRILSTEVAFDIRDVPSGTYRVFADWDIAEPAVRVVEDEGHTILNYIGSRGDYAGSAADKVAVEGAGGAKDIMIACTQPLILDQVFQDPGVTRQIVVTDIFFVRTASQEGRIVALIKNAAAVPASKEILELIIDEERQMFPVEMLEMAPGETQPYDITSFYRDYAKRHFGEDGSKTIEPRSVRFRLADPLNKEVVFDKTVFVM